MSDNVFDHKLLNLPLRPSIVIKPEDKLKDTLKFMTQENVGSIIIGNNDHLMGIFTERDYLLKILGNRRYDLDVPISSIMTSHPEVLGYEATVEDAMKLMNDRKFRHIPIMHECGKKISLVSIRDIIFYVHDEFLNEHNLIFDDLIEQLNHPDLRVINQGTLLEECIGFLKELHIGSVLVVDSDQQLQGILTERDFLVKVSSNLDQIGTLKVEDVMTSNPRCLKNSDKLATLMRYMREGKYRHIPILNGHGKPITTVSIRHVLNHIHESLLVTSAA